jgi:hypothetical protein
LNSNHEEELRNLGIDTSDFKELSLDELMAGSDVISLALLNAFFEPEVVNKLDEEGKARGVAFEIAYRYIVGMRIMAERFFDLREKQTALNKLL